MSGKEAEKMPFDDAIKSHKKMGIQTYTLTTECGKQCLIRQPTIIQTGKIMPFMIMTEENDADFNKAAIILMTECWIAGDDEIRKDDELKIECGLGAFHLVKMKTATVKKN